MQFTQFLGDFLLPGAYQLGTLHFRFPHRLLGARDILNRLTFLADQARFFALQGKQARQAFQPHPHQPFHTGDLLAYQRKLPFIRFDAHIQAINLLLQLQRALGQDFNLTLERIAPRDEFLPLYRQDFRNLGVCAARHQFGWEDRRWRFLPLRSQHRDARTRTVRFI